LVVARREFPGRRAPTSDPDWLTLGQAALKWLLAEPRVVTTLPNIYDDEQLAEFAAASDKADLSAHDLQRVAELYERNFGVDEEPMAFKGTMTRPADNAAAATPGQ